MIQINNNKSFVNTYQNQPGVLSKIFDSIVPDKRVHTLKNGTVLILDLQDSDGNQLPANTELFLGGKRITPIWPTDIDQKSYRPYNQINSVKGVSAQYDENNQAQLLIEVSKGKLDFIEGHEISLWVESSEQIDWDNSTIEFEVQEKAYRDNS
ncbi:MAG: hypothetical protein ACOCP4_02615 [Candidatus Woesearchaeota archaeon]